MRRGFSASTTPAFSEALRFGINRKALRHARRRSHRAVTRGLYRLASLEPLANPNLVAAASFPYRNQIGMDVVLEAIALSKFLDERGMCGGRGRARPRDTGMLVTEKSKELANRVWVIGNRRHRRCTEFVVADFALPGQAAKPWGGAAERKPIVAGGALPPREVDT